MAAAGVLSPAMLAASMRTLIGLLASTGMFSGGHPLWRKLIFVFAQLRG